MQTRIKSWDLRPFSEFFYEQAAGRKDFRFLYYCRNCIKNFDTPIRVQKCKFCDKQEIIELPKEVWKRRQVLKKTITAQSAKALFAKLARRLKPKEGLDFATRVRLAMIYYFDVPQEPTEESMGAEDLSQGDLLRSFRMV